LALAAAGAPDQWVRRDEEGVPIFPAGFHGSITHTGRATTFAAAAVSPTPLRVGLDAEEIRDLPQDMIEHVLTDEEIRRLTASRPEAEARWRLHARGELALLAFSAKEAFYKCIFPEVRCRLTFHQVDFRLTEVSLESGTEAGCFELRLAGPDIEGAPSHLPGRYLTDARRVVCAVQWRP
jgi:4'-phosphopantetheinyl transferase EntD